MVSNKCCIPGCRQSLATNLVFYKIWETNTGIKLNRFSRVCVNHFNPSDITSTWTSGEDCNRYSICLKKPKLKEAILLIFPVDISGICEEVKNSSMNEIAHNHNYCSLKINNKLNYVELPNAKRLLTEFDDLNSHNLSEVVIRETLLLNKLCSISFPLNWFCEITKNNTYFTLSPFSMYD